ncbi:MAG: hypothetical protein MMC33_009418 [Icmadophila ericetorum]|nr:hypothetical protein [Icmadophila ericetorum]
MVNHNDSESSNGDIDDYTTTNVLLGYASEERTDDLISQLGGQSIWIDATQPPSATYTSCLNCKKPMTLILQLHADLPDRFPGHERRLFVFICNRRTCRRKVDSVRAIRNVRVLQGQTQTSISTISNSPNTPQPMKSEPSHIIGNSIFNSNFNPTTVKNSNPFSLASSVHTTNPFSTRGASGAFTTPSEGPSHTSNSDPNHPQVTLTRGLSAAFPQQAQISTSSQIQGAVAVAEPQSEEINATPPYPKYYLDAEYETLDALPPTTTSFRAANMMADSLNTAPSPNATDDPEAFESNIDKAFQRFADRLAQNPEQVLRYEFNGLPLLYSTTDTTGMSLAPCQSSAHTSQSKGMVKSGMPSCANCGRRRIFELQLTPHAISVLEADELDFEGMEWGTIIVGVCEQDCQPRAVEKGRSGYLAEWVGVQWEEDGAS